MHLEALTEAGKTILPKLRQFNGFYLAGRTAMALQMGHRISEDFDLFAREPIKKNLLASVEKEFGSVEPLVNNHDQLTFLVQETKITFLHYPFPVIHKLILLEEQASLDLEELTATKAYTIGRRGTFKDYVDIYFAIKERHTSLDATMQLAEKKYESAFNNRLFLEQLVYLDDIPETSIRFLKTPVYKNDIKNFFGSEVKNIKL